MKKIMTFWIGTLLSMMLLTACGDDDLMKNYTTLAQNFTEKVFARDYDGATSYINEEMQESISADALAEIVKSTQAKYGPYQKIEAVEEISLSDYLELTGAGDTNSFSDNDYTVVMVTVAFESADMNFYLTYEKAGRTIVNLSVYDQTEAAGALSEDEMRASTRSFLNAVFSEDGETAYAMMSSELQSEMNPDELDALLEESASLYGAFQGVENILITGDDAVAYVTFAAGEINAYLTFDSAGKVSAFYTGDLNE